MFSQSWHFYRAKSPKSMGQYPFSRLQLRFAAKKNTQNWSHTQISSHIKFLLNLFPMKYDPNLVVNHFMVAFFASGDIVERFPRFGPNWSGDRHEGVFNAPLLKMGVESGK